MDIYSILASKPHREHHLNRYITFIRKCQQKNVGYEGYTENHHICPRANDMFPEYEDFRSYPWNCATLTPRQHFIAHIMLAKSFPSLVSCKRALLFMSNGKWKTFVRYSRVYEKLKHDMLEVWKNSSDILRVVNVGKAVVKNDSGELFRVDVNDERYLSGEFVGHTKGMRVVFDNFGNKIMSDNPELISIHKDMIPVKSECGSIIRVHRSSDEWKSGKLVAQHSGSIMVKDDAGNKFRVDASDPRYISGKLVGMTKGTITVKDKHGYVFRVDKNDPRYLSGELVGATSGKISINDGTHNRMIGACDEIPKGWKRGLLKKNSIKKSLS